MIFFTADTHFGHGGILTHQVRRALEFVDTVDMDAHLIDMINQRVGKDDTLYHLGDFCWQASLAGHYRQRLNVRKLHIVRGNHDSSSLRQHCSSLEHMKFLKIKYRDHTIKIHLCHYPLLSWGSLHHGGLHLYGHSHGSVEDRLNGMFQNRRSLDVGVDNIKEVFGHWGPISLPEVIHYLGATETLTERVPGPFEI